MKIYIFADMEGISGISGSDFVLPNGSHFEEGRRYYTWDINACVRGCMNAGADGVIVRDGHGQGNHALLSELDPRVEIIQGRTERRMPGIAECEGLILLGYHAMAGTSGALLEHTYSSAAIQNLWMNGRLVGEIGVDAAIAADYGVPTIMVSGDDHACREAEVWIPGVVTCQVKTGLGAEGARLLPIDASHRLIEAKAAEAVSSIRNAKPISVEHPVTLRKEMVERQPVPRDLARPGIKIIDGRTIEATASTVEQAFFMLL
ncbi:MAG: M55 family metallopeptidase [Armatimonadetes bacterium]|nr:M55 family metallopeptidase [Armatimonadota bacterium]